MSARVWLVGVFLSWGLVSCEKQEAPLPRIGNEAQQPLSQQCAACHQKEYRAWLESDHAYAARPPEEMPAEAFAGQEIEAHGQRLRMERGEQGELLVRELGSGKARPVRVVIGRRPLLQVAVEGERGAWQVCSAAWDVERHEWFDVFLEDERMQAEGTAERRPGEWGHWLGRGMVWNSQCAWCHMSGYRKNYDAASDSFASTSQEPAVSCVACHRVEEGARPAEDGCLVAREHRQMSREQHQAVCAACHARREELDERFAPGEAFENHFTMELPRVPGIFYPNAAQREEDYCETSFRHARMGAAGVTCYDCHDAHSGAVLASMDDNSLCLRCHGNHTVINGRRAPYVSPLMTFVCPRESRGHVCVECHMPESTYMGRDPRRDHSLMPPDPRLSAETGIPNTCLNCHADKGQEWTREKWEAHYGSSPRWYGQYRPRIRAVAAALRGEASAAELVSCFEREEIPAWRATLLGLMSEGERTPEVMACARRGATDANPMVRAAAAELLGQEAMPLLSDPLRSVRTAAARATLPLSLRRAAVAAELAETARHQADQPTGAMQAAMLAGAAGDSAGTERALRRAVQLDPCGEVARMDYAVFLAAHRRPTEALAQMLACTAAHPESAEAQYRLGLILAELGRTEAARRAMEKALHLAPDHARAAQALQQLTPAP